MDGVLCNSEEPSRRAAVDVFAEMGVEVTVEDFVPFMGTGEAKFLGGVASVKGVEGFNTEAAKKSTQSRNSGIGFPGALELITQCKSKGLKVAVASSADRIKVDANLAAAGLPLSICIAVTTTLSEETLKTAGPSLIRQEIGSVSLDDILSGGSVCHNEKMQGSQLINNSAQTSPSLLEDRTVNGSMLYTYSTNSEDFSVGGDTVGLAKGSRATGCNASKFYGNNSVTLAEVVMRLEVPDGRCLKLSLLLLHADYSVLFELHNGSRRDIVRYGSLGIAMSCLLFTITNWKAMQYVSPKALWNLVIGASSSPTFEQNEGELLLLCQSFHQKLDWLNTPPLKLSRDLKGKVVLLDFWTYCCINCMHVLPDLEYLEKKYKDMPFTVVGVHSAKFDNEKDLEAIRNAVLRYGITHPVVNDGDMYFWRELGVNSWPTFSIVGPNGLEKDNDPRLLTSPLKFPGKLAVDVLNNRLFISDSNHNRIVVTDLDGNFILQIGSTGEEGFRDGNFEDASFNRPQGLAYNAKRNMLYVADTENHALRVIDFVNEMVRTLAGNGAKVNETVYIAMAGQHQIWEHNTSDGVTKAFSGDGYERNLNGLSSTSTSFAQPSGISLSPDLKEAYIADSESSSIRALDLKTGGSRLLAGGDLVFSDNLFRFGDHDGAGSEVLLQHPLGVLCGKDGQVYIADSYNHKIKKLDPASKRVSTLAGTGKAGFKDGKALVAQDKCSRLLYEQLSACTLSSPNDMVSTVHFVVCHA
ncbi:haloacid dehalogenase-like hydrolase family protein [Actinidia rufa]|uniref:Haloacid dehalogenase-like hydrolase family protein n=1 Tax=Actinidia rufa TaxID=165716 RepID=A0A7J0DAN4_9ERIC|nr:haloacid dehalogenase-like hydrolase family protein [Actinidia rufa]